MVRAMELCLSSSSSFRGSPVWKWHHQNTRQPKVITIKPARKWPSTSPYAIKSDDQSITFAKVAQASHRKSSCSRGANAVWADSEAGALTSDSAAKKISSYLGIVWKFLGPPRFIGLSVAYPALLARIWMENSISLSWSLLGNAAAGFVAHLCILGFISGINQIYDVEIDMVNKPDRPIPAGELPIQTAWLLVTCFGWIGFLIYGLINPSPLLVAAYGFGFVAGTVYSAPPLRLKSNPLGAIVLMALHRGIFNFSVLYQARASLGLPFEWSMPAAFMIIFTSLFALVTAFIKDLSDIEGDRKYNINTLAVIFGARKIAFLCTGILLLNYVAAILAAIYMPQAFRRSVMIPAHTILALCLIFQAWRLEKANYNKEESLGFYNFLWPLFDAEYIIFPFI